MRLRWVTGITCVVCIIAMGIGLYQKAQFLDYNKEAEPLNKFTVGLLSDDILKKQLERMQDELENKSEIIAAVKCESKFEFLFSDVSQKVKVEHIFKGDKVKEGDSIDIVRAGSIIGSEGYGDGKSTINLSFVNEMVPGKTYLVFVDRQLENSERFLIGEDFILIPVFCYEDIENKSVKSLSDDGNYTLYENVKMNEYFFDSQKAVGDMKKFKKSIIGKYQY